MSGGNPGAEPGTLYVVATPIGNILDITLRALEILRTVDIIAAEDTRTTKKLLARYGIKGPKVVSYHEHNESLQTPKLLKFLRGGKSIALLSEAGSPCISDPGAYLVARVHREGLRVCPIPGPSALVAALSCSGFDLKRGFLFVGFLPSKTSDRRQKLIELQNERRFLVFYEAPHRLSKTLIDMLEIFGDREAFLAREMTKVHEEYLLATLAEFKIRFERERPRGEFTLVIKGSSNSVSVSEEEIKERLEALLKKELSTKEAVQKVAMEFDLPRRRVYQIAIKIRSNSSDGLIKD